MAMFVWWEAPVSSRVEWRCASMISGGQCVMTVGTVLMQLWSASSWDMQSLEVSAIINQFVWVFFLNFLLNLMLFLWSGGIPYSNAIFGAGTGPIYLDDVACTPSASQLLECSSSPISRHNCPHSADAGVGCEGSFCYLSTTWIFSCLAMYLNYSSLHNWSTATSGWKHSQWGPSGDLYGQCMGYCVWWLLGQ